MKSLITAFLLITSTTSALALLDPGGRSSKDIQGKLLQVPRESIEEYTANPRILDAHITSIKIMSKKIDELEKRIEYLENRIGGEKK